MRSNPRPRRSRSAFAPCIATHIGALLLFGLCAPAAGAGETAVAAVQDALPRLALPTGTRGLSLEGRIERIEEIIPHLATKEDLQATEAKLQADLQATKSEMKAEMKATEARLEKAIETKLEIAIANLRTEITEKMQEQLQNYLWINGFMVTLISTLLGGFLLWVVKFMLLPAHLEAPVRNAMRLEEERRAARAKSGDDEQEDADHP